MSNKLKHIYQRYKGSKKIDIVLILFLTLLFFNILLIKCPLQYGMNDDMQIMSVLSGRFTGETSMHAVFLLCPLTLIISTLYKIFNFIDWYAVVLISCKAIFYTIAMYKIIVKCKTIKSKLIAFGISFILILVFSNMYIYNITFTEVSIFTMVCVLAIFLLSEDKKHEKVIIIVGIALSLMIRRDGCLMLLPFMLPIGIYKCLGNVEKFKKYIILAMEVIITIGTILILNVLVDYFTGWNEYNEYNTVRSNYYDYYIYEIDRLPEETKNELYKESNITELDIARIQRYYLRIR